MEFPTHLACCGALALVAALLALTACGDEAAGTAGRTATASPGKRPVARAPAGGYCGRRVGPLVRSLGRLRERLAAGVTYVEYQSTVRGLRRAHGRVPAERLQLDCLVAVATPAERALNEYIRAANAWSGCVGDVTCDSYAIEPRLQREWGVASSFLSEAEAGLGRARPRRTSGP